MSNYLTKLRQKPKHVRDNIAFVAAGVSTIPVLLFILFGTHTRLADTPVVAEENQPQFFETLLGGFKQQLANLKAAVPEDKITAEEAIADRPDNLDATPVTVASNTPATSSRTILIATTSSSSAVINQSRY